MKKSVVLLALGACHLDVSNVELDAPPAHPVDAPPAEPKPAFAASPYMTGVFAIDDNGLREMYLATGTPMPSKLSFSLTPTGSMMSCTVTLKPHFVSFGTASTSTRYFKTVNIDVAASAVLDDQCHWDDTYMLQEIANQFGNVYIGFAKARFAEDQPYLDTLLDADKTFPNSTANITLTGHAVGWSMATDGSITGTMVQPTGGTLLPAVYEF